MEKEEQIKEELKETNFDYDRAIGFFNETNQKEFNLIQGLAYPKFITYKGLWKLKPIELLVTSDKSYKVLMKSLPMEVLYLRELYLQDYELDFTYKDLCDVLDTCSKKHLTDNIDKGCLKQILEANKKLNPSAVFFFKDLLN